MNGALAESGGQAQLRVPVADASGEIVKTRFVEFLKTFREDSEERSGEQEDNQRLIADYMVQIENMILNNRSTVRVNFKHLLQADHEVAEAIEIEFYRFEPYVRAALQECVVEGNENYIMNVDSGQRDLFVSFYNLPRVEKIRSMRTDKVGRLIAVSGTVTRSSEVRPELLYGSFTCKKCGTVHSSVEQQFQFTEPQICRNPQCVGGDFQLHLDRSAFVDWQRLRVQENADEIPPGSMPRSMDVICRNEIVEQAKAGDKIVFTGTIAVIPDSSGLSRAGESTVGGKTGGRGESFGDGIQGLKKLGVREMTYKIIFVACAVTHTDRRTGGTIGEMAGPGEGDPDAELELTDSEKNEILEMRNTPQLYNKMVESVCPSVFGHTDVKRGVLLMLFGGVHKKTLEKTSLRGDLNVCIVGDPSCAKSQFLKYVHGFLPRTVYTSGKSSSAAGLTASVVRDSETGEFCVEAGALMLADNGICCIDEFDKMDPNDQVAIHEAMEQQTISITKAGIQATLNARTSILAAANPVFGRYDRTKTLKANVNISAPIMSRFDLFFVILDECNPTIDEAIARHIIDVHREGGGEHLKKISEDVPFSTDKLRRYIRFARTLNPMITMETRKGLVDCYRLLRQNDILGRNKTAYRITVRQLESLIRLSEALARLHLDDIVRPVYVKEAYRLLQKSIIFVESDDIELEDNEEEMNLLEITYRKNGPFQNEENDDENGENGENGNNSDTADYDGDDNGKGKKSKNNRFDEKTNDDYEDEIKKENEKEREEYEERGDGEIKGDGDERDEGEEREDEVVKGGAKRKARDLGSDSGEPATKSSRKKKIKEEKSDKKGKKKTQISAKDYEDATQLLATRLYNVEENDPNFKGCLWSDLLTWYLNEFEYELSNVEIFDAKKKTVNQIIRRLVKHDLLIEYADDEEDKKNEDRLIRVSPQFQP